MTLDEGNYKCTCVFVSLKILLLLISLQFSKLLLQIQILSKKYAFFTLHKKVTSHRFQMHLLYEF